MFTATSRAYRFLRALQLRKYSSPCAGSRAPSNVPPPRNTSSYTELPRVQLLRYALTGSVEVPGNVTCGAIINAELAKQFSSHRLPWTTSPAEHPVNFTLHPSGGRDVLSGIQDEIQTKVKDRDSANELVYSLALLDKAFSLCEGGAQWEDLLATINGTLARLRKLGATDTKGLLLLGIIYASRCFSVPALRCYLQQYSANGYGYLTPEMAAKVIRHLNQALETGDFDVRMDGAYMRSIIVGNTDSDDRPGTLDSLLDISRPSDNSFLGLYAELLGKLGCYQRLKELWSIIRVEIGRGHTAKPLIDTVTSCLQGMIETGNPEAAIAAAQDISSCVDLNALLPPRLWVLLARDDSNGIIRTLATEKTIQSILTTELSSVELMLGLQWVGGDIGNHIVSRDTPIWCNSGNPEEAFESLGTINTTPSAQYLVDTFRFLTSTKSAANLSMMADILHEYDGVEMSLCTTRDDNLGQIELTWIIQCSPVEVLQNTMPAVAYDNVSLNCSSLGLLRVRQDCNGAPQKLSPHLYLMQLGYVAARNKTLDERNKSTPTGHLVCWDRQKGELILLWVGESCGVVGAGPRQSQPPPYFQYSCVKAGKLTEQQQRSEFDIQGLELIEIFKDERNVWIDIDPAYDLRT
ncbi:hypothetical protein LOZ53_003073 [Ophidiomyces ophidiicola]|nr:hypothetical protein LOZ64_003742 [Ophidiomyces ophidiicola]KAI1978321.1 hypothetical protein LOZ55_002842 [Ophidiomyces ophidiicola]KAI1989798.1 hypothetical protein LOZ51_005041 [Ophidiomyces ophidiicola]KAI1990885.1 hypothetical protein LOZ53_003073 [Ophidiomyces ophidiicola]KAI1992471.1 hypothetical protein LOZ54_001687 [Ophidiomyces ophidiicola]